MALKRSEKPAQAHDTGPTAHDTAGHEKPVSGAPNGSVTLDDMRAVALCALVRVAGDANAPAAAQAQAARSLLEVVGMLGPRAVAVSDTKPVSEMTAAEIDAELQAVLQSSAAVTP